MRRTIRLVVSVWALLALIQAGGANAASITVTAILTGANELPPNASPATGTAIVDFDNVAHTLRIRASFAGLLGTSMAAHIHAPTPIPLSGIAGVATQTPTFTGFPLGVTSGTMDQTLDTTLASTYNAPYITANGGTPASAETALFSAISAGQAYFNIHSSVFMGGEIRGFLVPVPVPASAWMGLGLLTALGAWRRFATARTQQA